MFTMCSFLPEYSCFTTLCQSRLYNEENQPDGHTHPSLRSLLPAQSASPPSRSSLSTRLSSLRWAAAPHWLLSHTWSCTHGNTNLPVRSPPSPCPRVHSVSASLFPPCKQVHLHHFYRFNIPGLTYYTCFSLPDLLHSMTASISIHTSAEEPVLLLSLG